MAFDIFSAISGGFGPELGKDLFGQQPPQFGFSVEQINELIEKYREAGLEGIKQIGIQGHQDATARLAASGLDPSLGLQQALFNPILQRLSGARGQLEGRLAGTEGNLLLSRAAGQQNADLAGFQNQQNQLSGLTDLASLAALFAF